MSLAAHALIAITCGLAAGSWGSLAVIQWLDGCAIGVAIYGGLTLLAALSLILVALGV